MSGAGAPPGAGAPVGSEVTAEVAAADPGAVGLAGEELLGRLRLEHELLLRAVGEGVVAVDAQGCITWVNPAACGELGYEEQELLGQRAHELVHHSRPDGSPYPRAECPICTLTTDSPRRNSEVFWRKDGTCFDVEYSTALVDGDSRTQALVVFRNVSDRKAVERELRRSEERYRGLFEGARDAIFTADLAGNLTAVNPAAQQLSGFDRSELLAMSFFDLLAPEEHERAQETLARRFVGGAEETVELELVAKDGRRVLVEVTGRLVEQEGEPMRIEGIARDTTERRLLEDELRQAQKMEAIGRLAGGVAHDFNNLLTGVFGFVEFALGHLAAGDTARVEHDLDQLKTTATRARELTQQLLAFGRRQALSPQVVQLDQAVGEIVPLLSRIIGEEIEIHELPGAESAWVRIDVSGLQQVLVNLCVNARDAMPDGGRIDISTDSGPVDGLLAARHGLTPGRYARIAVADSGSGIEQATLAHIFEPFFTTKDVSEGTGLGLATVHGIVSQSGGAIDVRSTVGEGTCFTIFLPLVAAKAEDETDPAPNRPQPALAATVLVVEDEPVVRDLTTEMLRNAGFDVHTAASPEAALQLVEANEQPVHLLLTDLVMPGMRGQELARLITTRRPLIKVVYTSGYSSDVFGGDDALPDGIVFLQKPYMTSELVAAVSTALTATDTTAGADAA